MSDLIERQKALDALKGKLNVSVKDTEAVVEYLNVVLERILQLPSAEPDWIPVSERLPEANGRYLVTRGLNACGAMWDRTYLINYSDLMGLKKNKVWWDGNVGKSDFETYDDVLAWMPLPKPYKEGEQE